MDSEALSSCPSVAPLTGQPSPDVLELDCAVVHNTWGKLGERSLVAKLKSGADGTFPVDSTEHYAQLWLGDHPSHGTKVILPGIEHARKKILLHDWLILNPRQLELQSRDDVCDSRLPFLLKVLSIRSPLALQAHPDKEMAYWLHSKEPGVFDSNHKPEMAIAVTPFTALIGFRPLQQVLHFLSEVEEFEEAMGCGITRKLREASETISRGDDSGETVQKEALKEAFARLVDRRNVAVINSLRKLVLKIKNDADPSNVPEYNAITRMDAEFPGDPGALTVFLLNLVHLQPGEAVFIDSLIPHTYITGDCIECQASSDNVLRAAFTHKRKDVDLMCSTLVYQPHPGDKFKVVPEITRTPEMTSIFYPSPCLDFEISKYQITKGSSSTALPCLPVASIVIVVQGQGQLFWLSSRCSGGGKEGQNDTNSNEHNVSENSNTAPSTYQIATARDRATRINGNSNSYIDNFTTLKEFKTLTENCSVNYNTKHGHDDSTFCVNELNNDITKQKNSMDYLRTGYAIGNGLQKCDADMDINILPKTNMSTTGNGKPNNLKFNAGTAIFLAAGTSLEIRTYEIDGDLDDVIIFRANSGHYEEPGKRKTILY